MVKTKYFVWFTYKKNYRKYCFFYSEGHINSASPRFDELKMAAVFAVDFIKDDIFKYDTVIADIVSETGEVDENGEFLKKPIQKRVLQMANNSVI